jgi:hypothetical protein
MMSSVVNYELRHTDLCAEGYALVERGLRLNSNMLGGVGGMRTKLQPTNLDDSFRMQVSQLYRIPGQCYD